MRRKLVMRKWVEYILLGILFIAIIIGMSDIENEELFLTVHIADLFIITIIGIMFMFFGRENN